MRHVASGFHSRIVACRSRCRRSDRAAAARRSRRGCRRCRSMSSMQATVAGSGSVSAVLTGTKLADHRHVRRAQVAGDHRAGAQGPGPRRARTGGLRPHGREDRRDQRHDQRHGRPDAAADHRPRKGPALRAASQRESARRQPVGLAAAAGEPTMKRHAATSRRWRCVAVAARARDRARAPAQQPPAAGLHRRAGGGRPRGVSGQLRELPPAGSRRPQRSAAARRQQLHEHLARRARRAICSSSSRARCRRRARTWRRISTWRSPPSSSRRTARRRRRSRSPPTTAVPIGSVADRRGADDRGRGGADRPDEARRRRTPGRAGAARPGARRRTRRRAGERRPLGVTVAGHGEELRAGHRRDAAQSGSRRLADGAPQLSGLEPQPADADHARQRQGSAARVGVGDERGAGQRADAARAQRHHLSDQHR